MKIKNYYYDLLNDDLRNYILEINEQEKAQEKKRLDSAIKIQNMVIKFFYKKYGKDWQQFCSYVAYLEHMADFHDFYSDSLGMDDVIYYYTNFQDIKNLLKIF